MKQLEYVTKYHIAMHTILLQLEIVLFFSFLVACITKIILLIIQSHLLAAQASSSFKHLDMCTSTYATHTFKTKVLCLVTNVQLF